LRSFNVNILALIGVCFSFYGLLALAEPSARIFSVSEQIQVPEDSLEDKKKRSRRPTYEEKDRQGDEFSNKTSESPLLLSKPSNINRDVTLDSTGEYFIIEEKVGENDYRPATIMTYDEYQKYQQKRMMRDYWQNKTGDSSGLRGRQDPKAGPLSLKIPVKGLAGPFGSDFVDIKPNGLVTLDFGYKHQHTFNPQIPRRQQSQGSPHFDNQIQLNVVGKIGEKLKMSINWDTKATFEFQNNFKIEYTGFEEDILQKVEVGQVSMPVNSSLIQGAQNLFGIKTKMQFGRLTMTSVLATQRGKSEEVRAQGGSTTRTFELKGDNYEEYRHFFLGHFFKDNYERSLRNLPIVTSGAKVTQVDVYITNSNNTTQNTRDIVAFLDLGETEANLYRKGSYAPLPDGSRNDNKTNNLYDTYKDFVNSPLTVGDNLVGAGMERGSDFEVLTNARKLKPEEFTFHPDLGYISLMTPLRTYEMLAVAYQYSYNGETHVIGEPVGTRQVDSSRAVILKMLKPTSVKTRLNSWDLMMKNVYSLGATQLSRDNFQLRVIYRDDLSGADIPNLQEGQNTKNIPIIRLLGADQLNPNNDPFPDGNLDYVEGVTVDSRYGRIIFPVLEPFGSGLERQFNASSEADLINKYVFYELYDSTKSDASNIAAKNKYYIKGRYQSSSSSEIPLQGAINLAQGSVKVTAGSRTLQEGVDYTVDYNQGKVKILDEGILASGQEIKINYEKQDLFNVRQKSFYGSRLDYRVNRDINIGGTILHQNERPTLTRVNIGDEPSSNTIWGLDMNLKKESRFLTKVIDKLPLIQTKVPSSITAQAEVAQMIPGHNKALNENGSNGAAFLDDFEAAETPYDLVRTPTKWKLASTPRRFSESTNSDVTNGYNRALTAWYNIDPTLYTDGGAERPNSLPAEIRNHFERAVAPQEIFPQLQRNTINPNLITLNLAYYPNQRGPYNYNPAMLGNPPSQNPAQNWGGMMREIRNDIDFDNANIQYIEFWMMNPFSLTSNNEIDGLPFATSNNGKLYFNLGNISEDVLRDGRLEYENGLPATEVDVATDNTPWGRVSNKQPLTNAFDSQTEARQRQDVGLDGLSNEQEAALFPAFANLPDPAADDFVYYLDGESSSLLERYKYFNGMDKNSPVNSVNSNYSTPDTEDLNQDNTLNTLDEYYEYEIDIDSTRMRKGSNFVVDVIDTTVNGDKVQWVQFRVPIRTPTSSVGGINGFKSIRFMRMYMTGFASPVVLRFAQLQLVANQWRVYLPDDINQKGFGSVTEPDDAVLVVSTVNIEENGKVGSNNRSPYVLPPGTVRDQDPVSANVRNINEQSLRLSIDNLDNLNARAAYKNVNFDLLNYRRLNMFIHAETEDPNTSNGDMTAFLRLGTDFTQNYYEIEVPLYFSQPGMSDPYEVWRMENEIDIAIQDMIDVKIERNRATNNKTTPYTKVIDGKRINVVGNPDLSTVVIAMVGMRNPAQNYITGSSADIQAKSATIWVNELRVSDFENKSSWAATARVNAKLADLATVTGSMKYTTVGFGGLDQRISQRQRNNTLEYGVSSGITLDKFIPQKLGIKLPMYVSFDRSIASPQYNPLDPDVKMSNYNAEERKELSKLVQDITTRRAINFTNFKKVKTKKDAKNHFYDISNLSFTVGYNEIKRTSYEIQEYKAQFYKGAVEYNYSFKAKSFEPFKKSKFAKPKSMKMIRDFNVNPVPSSFTFRNDIDRRLIKTVYYESGPQTAPQEPLYEKSFMLLRTYALPWNLTKSINLNYTSNAQAIVDEPNRAPGDQAYRDTLWKNFWSFGRLKTFNQNVNATYKLPLDKIPLLFWLNSDLNYTAGFVWMAGPMNLRDSLGNNLELGNMVNNKRDINLTGKINLEALYNKVKFLKEINNPRPPQRGPAKPAPAKPGDKDTTSQVKKPDLKGLKATLRALMLVRNINVTCGMNRTTQLAGYMPTPSYLGVDAHGDYNQAQNLGEILPFVFGAQDPRFRHTAAERGWISKERELNTPFLQVKSFNFSARTAIEPFRDFKIQVDIKKTKGSNYQELFRVAEDTSGSPNPVYVSENPSQNGSYSISYITLMTAFTGTTGADNFNQTFERFQENRRIILARIGKDGYTLNSQDVLVPAFLAAYTGRDVQKQKITSFPKIPLPNWNLTYSGLNKVGFFSKKFSSAVITHGYTSTYAVGSYQSSLLYADGFIRPEFDAEQNIQGNLLNEDSVIVPVYVFSDVAIREQFGPLIGLNLKSKGRVTYRIEYKRGRSLALSMANAQLREDINQDFVLGISYTKSGVKLPKFQGRSTVLKNELNIRMDMTIRDTKSYQRKLEEGSTITAGNLNFQLKPTVAYNVSQRVTMMLYFEHTRAVPRISTSFKRNTTSVGLQIRFTLS
jgi:cell surface protein SprA